ncbi:MAG: hypothetical protein EAZ94_24030 [Oscillatoriales cyanobacterium]|nr:MAG: hypothetical protein EAZ94_24030 [Oscillatoriales cyanobacterium]
MLTPIPGLKNTWYGVPSFPSARSTDTVSREGANTGTDSVLLEGANAGTDSVLLLEGINTGTDSVLLEGANAGTDSVLREGANTGTDSVLLEGVNTGTDSVLLEGATDANAAGFASTDDCTEKQSTQTTVGIFNTTFTSQVQNWN